MFNEAMKLKWQAEGAYLCAKCGEPPRYLEPLQVSHFFNVRKSGTRFDPDNVDPLHRDCHTGYVGTSWEYQKHEGGEYRDYMVRKLGEEGFTVLDIRAHQHVSLEAAKAAFVEKLRGMRL